MAELRGALGAVFKGAAAIYSKNIEFDPDNDILNSDSAFVTKGFTNGMHIQVYGSVLNDGSYTIGTAAAGKLTVVEDVLGETAATNIFIYSSAPGTQVTGFYGWKFDQSQTVIDATDFADAGSKTFIAADLGWTATAQRHWMSDSLIDSYLGTQLLVRFFVKYSASPSAPAPVYLYEGLATCSGLAVNTGVGSLVEQPLTFTGISPLVYRSYTAYP